jgi:hypothetical protein
VVYLIRGMFQSMFSMVIMLCSKELCAIASQFSWERTTVALGKPRKHNAAAMFSECVDDQIWQVWKNRTIWFAIPEHSVLVVSEQN